MPLSDESVYQRVFALVTAGILAVALSWMIRPFVGPILWALLLAFLLSPVNEALGRGLRRRRGLAALLITIASILLILLPAVMLGLAFVGQATDLVGRIEALAQKHQITKMSDVFHVPLLQGAIDRLLVNLPVSADQVQTWLVQAGQNALRIAVAMSGALVVGAFGVVVGFVLVLFLLFFFLRDGAEMVRRAVRLIPMDPVRKADLLAHLSAVTRAVVLGTLLTAITQGLLLGIGFALVGLPTPVVFGVLTSIVSLVPMVGTALVWVPATGVLLFQDRWWAAVFLLAWSLGIVGTVDNVLRPLVVSGRAQISTLPVFLGLMGGLSAFGAIGLVLGPVIVALVIALLRFAEESRPAE